MKLHPKVLSLVLGILIISMAVLSIPLYWYLRSALEKELDKRLLSAALVISNNLNEDFIDILIKEPELPHVREKFENELVKFAMVEIYGVSIYKKNGVLLAKRNFQDVEVNGLQPLLLSFTKLIKNQSTVSEIFELDNGIFVKAAAVPYKLNGHTSAIVIVWAGAEFMTVIDQILGSIFWIILVTIIVAVSLTIVFSQSLIKPVKALSYYAKSIEKNIHTEPINLNRQDEYGDLNRSLIDMHTEIKKHEQSTKQLLSGIAHEIKNPLGGMEIYAGLLNEEFSKNPLNRNFKEHKSYLKKITQELHHLKQIVLEYLDYARPAGSTIEKVSIQSVCEDVFRILQPEMKQKNIHYHLTGEGVVLGDKSKIRRVFLNLLKNSYEAVDESGEIGVNIQNSNESIKIKVFDNGKGISSDDLEKIFNPYFTTHEKGYGLGLTIVKNIVDEMNGTIIVESEIGKGTNLILEFPQKKS